MEQICIDLYSKIQGKCKPGLVPTATVTMITTANRPIIANEPLIQGTVLMFGLQSWTPRKDLHNVPWLTDCSATLLQQ